VSPDFAPGEGAIFYGGLGQASGGIQLDPDLLDVIYPYSLSNVAHGCFLEGVALAMSSAIAAINVQLSRNEIECGLPLCSGPD
jgi:hypothetical protein